MQHHNHGPSSVLPNDNPRDIIALSTAMPFLVFEVLEIREFSRKISTISLDRILLSSSLPWQKQLLEVHIKHPSTNLFSLYLGGAGEVNKCQALIVVLHEPEMPANKFVQTVLASTRGENLIDGENPLVFRVTTSQFRKPIDFANIVPKTRKIGQHRKIIGGRGGSAEKTKIEGNGPTNGFGRARDQNSPHKVEKYRLLWEEAKKKLDERNELFGFYQKEIGRIRNENFVRFYFGLLGGKAINWDAKMLGFHSLHAGAIDSCIITKEQAIKLGQEDWPFNRFKEDINIILEGSDQKIQKLKREIEELKTCVRPNETEKETSMTNMSKTIKELSVCDLLRNPSCMTNSLPKRHKKLLSNHLKAIISSLDDEECEEPLPDISELMSFINSIDLSSQ